MKNISSLKITLRCYFGIVVQYIILIEGLNLNCSWWIVVLLIESSNTQERNFKNWKPCQPSIGIIRSTSIYAGPLSMQLLHSVGFYLYEHTFPQRKKRILIEPGKQVWIAKIIIAHCSTCFLVCGWVPLDMYMVLWWVIIPLAAAA